MNDMANHERSAGSAPQESGLAQHVLEDWKTESKEQTWSLEYFFRLSRDILARSTVPGYISNTSSLLQRDPHTDQEFTEDERTRVYLNVQSLYIDVLKNGENHDMPLQKPEFHSLTSDTIFLGFLWECIYDARPQNIYIDRAIRILESVAEFMARQNEKEVSTILLSQVKTLRIKAGDLNAASRVLDLPFASLSAAPISLDQVPAARYRFIDAVSFSNSTSLRVVESEILPKNRYAAISYVWKGLPPSSPQPRKSPPPTMTIQNADNADPISLETLRIACLAALQLSCPLLWLDGLCIKQGDEDDKAWQVGRMFSIYQHCRVCLILPGGLSRFVALHEETNWVSRAWTLQEAIAPPRCKVLFSWRHGNCCLIGIAGVYVEQIQGEQVGMAELMGLLGASNMVMDLVTKSESGSMVEDRQQLEVNLIVGDKRPGDVVQRNALIGALDLKGKEGMASAIWRAAMMRTAYRPVDMILSIMGMFGVSLDARKFAFDDRLGAAVALMREILASGGKAEWLGVIPSIPPGKVLSTTPHILELGAGIEGHLRDRDAMETGLLWWLKGAPSGFVDDEGYVNITAPVASVKMASAEESGDAFSESARSIRDYGKRRWEIIGTEGESSSPPYAVHLGEKKNYLNGIYPVWLDPENNLFMLVDRDSNGGLRVTGYAVGKSEVLESCGWCANKTIRAK